MTTSLSLPLHPQIRGWRAESALALCQSEPESPWGVAGMERVLSTSWLLQQRQVPGLWLGAEHERSSACFNIKYQPKPHLLSLLQKTGSPDLVCPSKPTFALRLDSFLYRSVLPTKSRASVFNLVSCRSRRLRKDQRTLG